MATRPKAREMMSLRTAPTRFVKDLAQIDRSRGLRHRTGNEAVTMFGSLKTFISNFVRDARPRNKFENEDCRLAAAALLIRVATAEREMWEARRGKLHAVLKSGFGLDDLTTVQLIDDAVGSRPKRD